MIPPKQTEVLKGLLSADIPVLQKKYGKNTLKSDRSYRFFNTILDIIKEPMFILLAIACTLYFILGNIAEGIMMSIAIALVTGISLFQETRSAKALQSLRMYMEPKVRVIRDATEQDIESSELVPGDLMVLEEGMRIPADATLLSANDLSTDDSIITVLLSVYW